MIFIIDKLLSDLDSKEKAWEDARDKWVKGASEYEYRYERDYRRNHPSPKDKIRATFKAMFTIIAIVHIVFIFGFFVFKQVTAPDKPKPEVNSVTYKNGDDCGKYKVGDIGYISYGDYEGAEVKIIGGCDSDYEVQVTKDQTLFAEGSENAQYNDKAIKAGLVFKVNNGNNLIITGHDPA